MEIIKLQNHFIKNYHRYIDVKKHRYIDVETLESGDRVCAKRQTEGVWFDVLEGITCDDAAAGIMAYFSFILAFIESLFILRGSRTA